MQHLWTLGILALFVVPAVGCGDSSPTELREPKIARATVKLSLPERVVAVPSTDSRFAMEALVPMVASESAGVNAYIYSMGVEATDEATGATSRAHFINAKAVETIPGGGSVEIPFRVYLSSTGTYKMKVTLDTWDAGAPAGNGNAGSFQLWDNQRSGERSLFSGEFRILPPQ